MQGKHVFGKPRKFRDFTIYGWVSDAQAHWYKQCANKVKNGKIVEVGVFGGQSLLSIVDICVANNNKLYGIDPWDLINLSNGKKPDQEFLLQLRSKLKECKETLDKIIEKYNYGETLELIRDFSPGVADKFEDKSLDLVFIDGDHSYNQVTTDLNAWLPKVKPGGILAGDDFVWRSVEKAVKDFCRTKGLTLKFGNQIGADLRTWRILI